MKKVTRICLGFLMVLVGVIGIIMPIMPGWIFLIPGLILLAEHFHWARRFIDWFKDKAERYGGEHYRKYAENSRRSHARREAARHQ